MIKSSQNGIFSDENGIFNLIIIYISRIDNPIRYSDMDRIIFSKFKAIDEMINKIDVIIKIVL